MEDLLNFSLINIDKSCSLSTLRGLKSSRRAKSSDPTSYSVSEFVRRQLGQRSKAPRWSVVGGRCVGNLSNFCYSSGGRL